MTDMRISENHPAVLAAAKSLARTQPTSTKAYEDRPPHIQEQLRSRAKQALEAASEYLNQGDR